MAADMVAGETVVAEFGILGPLQVLRSGRVVPLGGPRQRAVLALLLLEANRAVSMDRLAEDVWGGQPPEGWVTTLQTYVFHLRRAVEPDRARGGGCTHPSSPTTRRWTGTAAARPRSRPTRPKPPRFLPQRGGHLAGRRRAAGSSPGRGGGAAACWPSARRWRSPRPCASSP